MDYRVEKDSLGERKIPIDAYYGIHTLRAMDNFPISGMKAKPLFIDATVHIKRAAAEVNKKLKLLSTEKADAIIHASDEILSGELREWFVVDVYQAGAGTSHHMNINEVIANRAIELLGGEKGEYSILHPNDHVNMAQSTNDVIPTAIRLSIITAAAELLESLRILMNDFSMKGDEFHEVVKAGRTHLQDAVPIRLGQEFKGYASSLEKHIDFVKQSLESCRELGIGGTAVGTGLNAHPDYRSLIVKQLSMQLHTDFRAAEDYFEAMQSLNPVVAVSNSLRNLAQDLNRITNDLRLLSSGPMTGLNEIKLPPVQPGSSIMPGKVNPVIAEMMNMVCYQVFGCDTTIFYSAQAGQLELNVMMPVVAFNVLHEIEILARAMEVFSKKCVAGIEANVEQCRMYAETSMGIFTVLNPHIGYSNTAELVKDYLQSGKSVKELLIEKDILDEHEVEQIFDLHKLTEPGIHF